MMKLYLIALFFTLFCVGVSGQDLPDSPDIVVAPQDGEPAVPVHELKFKDFITCIQYSPDEKMFLTVANKELRLWDAKTCAPIGKPMIHNDWVGIAVFSPDGKKIASGKDNDTLYVWDVATQKPDGKHIPLETEIEQVILFSPDGSKIAATDYNANIRLWDAKTKQPIGKPMKCRGRIQYLAFSPDGSKLVSVSPQDAVRLWDVATQKLIGQLLKLEGWGCAAFFTPDNKRIIGAVTDEDSGGFIHIWDAATLKQIGAPIKSENSNHMVEHILSPDGKVIATGDFHGQVWLWDAVTGKCLGPLLDEHSASISDLIFSGDGCRIVSTTFVGEAVIYVHDAKTRLPVCAPIRTEDAINAIAVNHDGTLIIASTADKKVRMWKIGK